MHLHMQICKCITIRSLVLGQIYMKNNTAGRKKNLNKKKFVLVKPKKGQFLVFSCKIMQAQENNCFKGPQKPLEGRMRPPGRSLAMPALWCHLLLPCDQKNCNVSKTYYSFFILSTLFYFFFTVITFHGYKEQILSVPESSL